MKIAIVGGTGKEGQGMAARWARAGHTVCIGSRDADRARAAAAELSSRVSAELRGDDNRAAVDQAEVVVLSVPYAAHADTLRELAPRLDGKVVIDITVPLKPPAVTRVELPEGKAAALEAQALVPG